MVKPSRFVANLEPYQFTPQDVWSAEAPPELCKLTGTKHRTILISTVKNCGASLMNVGWLRGIPIIWHSN